MTAEPAFPPTPSSTDARTASPGQPIDPNGAPDGATEPLSPENGDSGDVDCGRCGLWFTSAAAFNAHRRDGKCLWPTEAGLVVAPRFKLTWSVPIKVPTAVDAFGNLTEWTEMDPEVAGQWDSRVWRDYP
jgi:hypothetical protein